MKNGIIDAFFSTLQNNPSVAAGTCTFAIAFALMAGNAFYAQSGTHPDPIWATRDTQTTQSITPQIRPVKVKRFEPKAIPMPRTGDIPRSQSKKAERSELVASIQQALVASGDYAGEVDGLIGPITRAAIKTYQKRHDLEQTGIPTDDLLARIENDTPKQVASSGGDSLSELISQDSGSPAIVAGFDRNLVRKIQEGIAKSGIAEIEADGIFGDRTEAAIIDFQRRNNLDVTGKPDIKVLEKLVKLGLV